MENEKLSIYFKQLVEASGVADIGYHKLRDGRVCPVSKTNTSGLSIEAWKDAHAKKPLRVDETLVLQEIVSSKKPVIVNDVKNDPRSANAFFFFGIDSIMIIPVVLEDRVEGIFCLASIGKLHPFTQKQIDDCTAIVEASKEEMRYL